MPSMRWVTRNPPEIFTQAKTRATKPSTRAHSGQGGGRGPGPGRGGGGGGSNFVFNSVLRDPHPTASLRSAVDLPLSGGGIPSLLHDFEKLAAGMNVCISGRAL